MASKPGFKTSEFWLASAASLLGMLYASGAISDGGTASKIVGFAALALSTLGYSVSRGLAKGAEK